MNIQFLNVAAAEVVQTPTFEWNLWLYVYKLLDGKYFSALTIISVLLCTIVPYLLGSINPAIILSRKIYHDDIRTHGSGNAGTTNTLRTYGKKMSILVFVCDLLKAAIATGFGWLVMGHNIGGAMAGFFVIFGHMFPIYYKFKGGKGVACACAVILMMSPLSFVVCLSAFLIVVITTKYVSMASVTAAFLYPLVSAAFLQERQGAICLFAVFISVFIIFMHRENLKGIFHGKENKLDLGKKKKQSEGSEPEETRKNRKGEKGKKEKIYKDSDFVSCECGRVIPISRKECVYCGAKNPYYIPKSDKSEK